MTTVEETRFGDLTVKITTDTSGDISRILITKSADSSKLGTNSAQGTSEESEPQVLIDITDFFKWIGLRLHGIMFSGYGRPVQTVDIFTKGTGTGVAEYYLNRFIIESGKARFRGITKLLVGESRPEGNEIVSEQTPLLMSPVQGDSFNAVMEPGQVLRRR